MQTRRSLPVLFTALLAAIGFVLVDGPAATAETAWADADSAVIHPGVQMYTDGAQCTANFVFSDATDVYLGYAAHCAGLGAATDTDGCAAESLPLGTPVEIAGSDGTTAGGTLAYSSWRTMARNGEDDPSTCAYNDFALVRIDPADVGRVNPSVPHWGGPQGINSEGTRFGETVHSYGNSSLRLGLTALSPKEGTSLGTPEHGWTHPVYTATPGIPGDSGSALLDSRGRATGVLSTLAVLPLTGSNNYSDLNLALDYARTHSTLTDLELVPGTETFDGSALLVGS